MISDKKAVEMGQNPMENPLQGGSALKRFLNRHPDGIQWTGAVVAVATLVVAMDVGLSTEFASLFCLVLGSLCIVFGLTIYAQETTARPPENSRNHQSGHVMVEFALSYTIVLLILIGTVGYGLTFYQYNQLQSTMRGAARFGSLHPFDLPIGQSWAEDVKNMAVYGDPNPDNGAEPLVPGLSKNHIAVDVTMPSGVPELVTVSIDGFTIEAAAMRHSVSKPRVTFPYLGRVEVQ